MNKILLLIILPFQVYAQDFTGIWKGFLYTTGSPLPYELAISETDGKLSGYSLTIFIMDGKENTGVKSMKIKTRKENLIIEDDDLVYNDYTTASKRVTLFGNLSFEKEDTFIILAGSFFTRSLDRSSYKGTIRLQKVKNNTESKLAARLNSMNLLSSLSFTNTKYIKKENEPVVISTVPTTSALVKSEKTEVKAVSVPVEKKLTPASDVSGQKKTVPDVKPVAAADLATRKTEIIRNIYFQSDSLILSLYDNGEIDGDTVSIVVNDKVIIGRQGLSATSFSTTLHIHSGEGDSLRLVMYAENLGRIPPNTGVLVIQDGNEKHQVRFEGDLNKNPAIILRRKH